MTAQFNGGDPAYEWIVLFLVRFDSILLRWCAEILFVDSRESVAPL